MHLTSATPRNCSLTLKIRETMVWKPEKEQMKTTYLGNQKCHLKLDALKSSLLSCTSFEMLRISQEYQEISISNVNFFQALRLWVWRQRRILWSLLQQERGSGWLRCRLRRVPRCPPRRPHPDRDLPRRPRERLHRWRQVRGRPPLRAPPPQARPPPRPLSPQARPLSSPQACSLPRPRPRSLSPRPCLPPQARPSLSPRPLPWRPPPRLRGRHAPSATPLTSFMWWATLSRDTIVFLALSAIFIRKINNLTKQSPLQNISPLNPPSQSFTPCFPSSPPLKIWTPKNSVIPGITFPSKTIISEPHKSRTQSDDDCKKTNPTTIYSENGKLTATQLCIYLKISLIMGIFLIYYYHVYYIFKAPMVKKSI